MGEWSFEDDVDSILTFFPSGTGECFLWKAGTPPWDLRVFQATGNNEFMVHTEASFLSFGGGLVERALFGPFWHLLTLSFLVGTAFLAFGSIQNFIMDIRNHLDRLPTRP